MGAPKSGLEVLRGLAQRVVAGERVLAIFRRVNESDDDSGEKTVSVYDEVEAAGDCRELDEEEIEILFLWLKSRESSSIKDIAAELSMSVEDTEILLEAAA
jgi:hypothetical protein